MRRSHIWILVAAMLSPVSRAGPSAAQGGGDSDASPIYGVTIPDGYRQWEFVAVSREADPLNELRAILANAVALTAYRAGTTPFPDGTILAKLAWK